MENTKQKTVHLTITVPSGVFYEGDVPIVTLKTAVGYIALQPGREPLFSSVEIGNVFIGWKSSPECITCVIGGGLVYADKEKINIITDDIINVKNIDLVRAQNDRDKLQAMLSDKKSDTDISKLELKLKKTLSRIDSYNLYNK
ncbi:ATP synthase F1 subunit epsilon [Mycoplasma corogypsi]|uniref:ATP synthase F1 subunit epsilon n=1 Tax=Mycoplasma corogypsi TaxID=2106 RepID=UPI003872C67F